MISRKDIYCKTQTNKYVKRSTRGYSFLEATELITSFISSYLLTRLYIYLNKYIYIHIFKYISQSLYIIYSLFDLILFHLLEFVYLFETPF